MRLLLLFISLITITVGCIFLCKADGKSQSNARIYKGKDAQKNKYPFYIDI